MSSRDHFVYRAFDAEGRLLYVGCTKAPKQRRAAHRWDSPWFKFATRFTMAGPYEKSEAYRREDEAIESELPWFNATRADRGNVTRWRSAHSREWEKREPGFAVYSPETGWNHEAMEALADACTATVSAIFGPQPDVDTRLANYLAAVDSGAMERSA